ASASSTVWGRDAWVMIRSCCSIAFICSCNCAFSAASLSPPPEAGSITGVKEPPQATVPPQPTTVPPHPVPARHCVPPGQIVPPWQTVMCPLRHSHSVPGLLRHAQVGTNVHACSVHPQVAWCVRQQLAAWQVLWQVNSEQVSAKQETLKQTMDWPGHWLRWTHNCC